MTWELGPDKDFSKLLEYEWRLEEFLRTNPRMSGICQYHAETVPRHIAKQGLQSHQSIFMNQTLSVLNPVFAYPECIRSDSGSSAEIDSFLDRVLRQEV